MLKIVSLYQLFAAAAKRGWHYRRSKGLVWDLVGLERE